MMVSSAWLECICCYLLPASSCAIRPSYRLRRWQEMIHRKYVYNLWYPWSYVFLSSLVISQVFSIAARLISTALLENLSLITLAILGMSTIWVAQAKAPNIAVFTMGSPPTINPNSRQPLGASAVAMLKAPLIFSSLGCSQELTMSHPSSLRPPVTSSYLSRDWSRTTTALGFSTCDTTAIAFVEIRVKALTGTPLLSARKDGAAVTPW